MNYSSEQVAQIVGKSSVDPIKAATGGLVSSSSVASSSIPSTPAKGTSTSLFGGIMNVAQLGLGLYNAIAANQETQSVPAGPAQVVIKTSVDGVTGTIPANAASQQVITNPLTTTNASGAANPGTQAQIIQTPGFSLDPIIILALVGAAIFLLMKRS